MERLLCIIIGYILGLFQTGYIYGKLNHVDIRKYGSGNAGTTNALRVFGKKAGLITFLGDCLKTLLAVWIVKAIFKDSTPEMIKLLGFYAGIGAILGHNFPFYLKFKGGKGIAATAGIIVSFNPLMTIIGFLVFVGTVAITRYVSLGSLLLVSGFLIELVIMGQLGVFQMSQPLLYELYGIGILITLLAFYKHKENIRRLVKGTENKLGEQKKN